MQISMKQWALWHKFKKVVTSPRERKVLDYLYHLWYHILQVVQDIDTLCSWLVLVTFANKRSKTSILVQSAPKAEIKRDGASLSHFMYQRLNLLMQIATIILCLNLIFAISLNKHGSKKGFEQKNTI